MHMPNDLLHMCGVVGRSNKHFNADVTLPIHLAKQVSSFTPAANAEILYILPSPQLSPYLNTYNIIYTRATMHSATHQPPTFAKDLEDVDIDTMSRADSLINPATREGATAAHGTAAEESQKERAKLTKTGAYPDLAPSSSQYMEEKAQKLGFRASWKQERCQVLWSFLVALILAAVACGIIYRVVFYPQRQH